MSGSGISWAICKSAPRSRQITMPTPHHSVFYRPDALPATQPTASKHWRHKSYTLSVLDNSHYKHNMCVQANLSIATSSWKIRALSTAWCDVWDGWCSRAVNNAIAAPLASRPGCTTGTQHTVMSSNEKIDENRFASQTESTHSALSNMMFDSLQSAINYRPSANIHSKLACRF